MGWIALAIIGYVLYQQQQAQAPIDWNTLTNLGSEITNTVSDALSQFANAITNFEGQPGDRNYRNNNPGNLRYAGQAGAVGVDPQGFAIFDTWADGVAALQRQIALDASRHPDWTITDFVNSYAPPSDNNPNNANYARTIASALGVDVNTTLGELQLS